MITCPVSQIRRTAGDQPVDRNMARQRVRTVGTLTGSGEHLHKGVAEQDFGVVTPLVGGAISLVHDVRPAADIVRDMIDDATRILNRCSTK
jgi:hypothetical protein